MTRRSATSSPPEPVFFSDEDWLGDVAARGWVLLTLDARLRYNRLERDA